jgi:hypothetical protein
VRASTARRNSARRLARGGGRRRSGRAGVAGVADIVDVADAAGNADIVGVAGVAGYAGNPGVADVTGNGRDGGCGRGWRCHSALPSCAV